MNKGKYVFSQVIDFVPKYQFDQLVKQYNGNYRVRVFTCWEQFLCLTFGHLTFRNSLRDIVLCLAGEQIRRYHLGFRSKIARATFSDANQNRDWRIYRDFAAKLMDQARQLYHDSPKELEAPIPIYALDSTLIRMCVGIFTWANYRKTTAGVKMHTLLDVNTAIPHFVCLTDGKVSDNKVLELLRFEVDALYVMDRGYFDLKQLNRIHLTPAFFVLRVKRTINFRRQYSQSTAEHDHIKFDQIGVFHNWQSRTTYPHTLRLIKVVSPEQDGPIYLLTNNMHQEAHDIAEIYRQRWQVELFFKWIKQHLKIQTLWGESENAVYTQLYSALSAYLLIAIIRKRLNIHFTMYQILQILSVSMLDKAPLNQLLMQKHHPEDIVNERNQLSIWEF